MKLRRYAYYTAELLARGTLLFLFQKFQAISAAYTKLVSSDTEEEDDDIPNVSHRMCETPRAKKSQHLVFKTAGACGSVVLCVLLSGHRRMYTLAGCVGVS